jgi:hypothetical protein
MQRSGFVENAVTPGCRRLAAIPLCVLLLSAPQLQAQDRSYPYPMRPDQSSGVGSSTTRGSESPQDLTMSPEFSRETAARREAARKVERKKRMVDSANRLLALTQQLRAELATREATPDDAKRLDEIARLARLVKDQMRD